MNHIRFFVAMLAIPILAGCGGLPEPADEIGYERRPATLIFHNDPAQVEAPDSVDAETPFTIAVTTYGDGCTQMDTTEVQVTGLRADVRPWNQEAVRFPPNTGCTQNLVFIPHEVEITFEEAGPGTIAVFGLRLPEGEETVVEHTMHVRR